MRQRPDFCYEGYVAVLDLFDGFVLQEHVLAGVSLIDLLQFYCGVVSVFVEDVSFGDVI